jgi:hypothetical protein
MSRLVLFVLTGLVVVFFYMPLGHADYQGIWGDGTFGFDDKFKGGRDLVIHDLAPGSPAQRAGVRVGDRYVARPFSVDWLEASSPKAGDRTTIHFIRPGGFEYAVTVTATEVPNFRSWDRVTGILAIIPATIFLVVAFALVYLRPSVMTWSFYAFAVGYFSTAPTFEYFHSILPVWAFIALTFVLSTFTGNFAVMPLLPFVIRFPDDHAQPELRRIDRIVWFAIVLAFAAYAYGWYYGAKYHAALPWDNVLNNWLPLGVFAVAALILISRFKHSPAQTRQRFGFLVIGLIVAFAAYAVYFVPGVPFALAQIVGYAVIVMPISVGYAALRERVIDVNFVLNRAIVYGLVSLTVIAIVSLIDWFFSHVVSGWHLAVVAELGATICVGLLLDRINRAIEFFVETVLFRRRRLAEHYLTRAANALPYATNETAIAEGLTQVPVDALRLAAAAVYRRSFDGGRFEGVATSHDTTVAPPGFDGNHLLVRMLESSEERVWLDELRTHLDKENSAIYVLAIPVCVRHELVAFTLYGAHRNGAQIDPEEVKLLEDLSVEASRAFDHVDAVRTRERYTSLSEARPEIV